MTNNYRRRNRNRSEISAEISDDENSESSESESESDTHTSDLQTSHESIKRTIAPKRRRIPPSSDENDEENEMPIESLASLQPTTSRLPQPNNDSFKNPLIDWINHTQGTQKNRQFGEK